MMRARMTIVSAAVLMGVLGPALAWAGGGFGGGGTDFGGLLCFDTRGERVARAVTLSSDLGDYANARVDRARLLCTEVTGSVQVGELDAVADGDVIACYDLTIPGRTNLKEAVTIANMLNTETVRLGEPVLLCILTLR